MCVFSAAGETTTSSRKLSRLRAKYRKRHSMHMGKFPQEHSRVVLLVHILLKECIVYQLVRAIKKLPLLLVKLELHMRSLPRSLFHLIKYEKR